MKVLVGFIAFTILSSSALAEFKVPLLSAPVVDKANVMTYDDEKMASEIIRELHQAGKAQLVLVTVPTLDGLTIEQAGIKISDEWKLGSAKEDNGILLIAAVQERSLRIEVGQGLEGTITDVTANRIIEDIVVPTIRSSNLSNGLLAGVAIIAQTIDPEILKNQKQPLYRQPKRSSSSGLGSLVFIILVFIVVILRIAFGPRMPGRYYGGTWGGGRGGFGGFGGGGFGGGGGGFSGGGASGRW